MGIKIIKLGKETILRLLIEKVRYVHGVYIQAILKEYSIEISPDARIWPRG